MIDSYITHYKPREDEMEKASYGYLMSVMVVMAGLPLPIINLLATLLFYLFNRKATFYVRWHCTQALLSQFTILIINSIAFTWTIKAFTGTVPFSDKYFAYIITILIVNALEIIVNISAAIRVRKGIKVQWWLWGPLTNLLMKEPAKSPNHII